MKIRQQGNSLVVTVPSRFDFKAGDEVIAVKGRDHSITYVPKMSNPFKDKAISFDHEDEAFNDMTAGRDEI
ncbi:MAG: AbrB family transcriptional regulator [Lentilactobacillus hilgardii]|uniref:type II toxin-antitoxin system PemI/MazE family antitoxin n=2 Tax=Lentilactobacillus hilgardii TaxID=1588 RepID=UPI001CC1DE7B|nr:AbrB family transcriptional regulator [Lentilactobacillus hilgardii]MBZ2201514.1 AbrB family transcriptional regulator [Lentilactobacillus hilgardii]MBZ2204432.1 AbrB family transcriptional regulator [Lentilactobacillus hilgardii]